MNNVADKYREAANEIILSSSAIEYFSYFRKYKYKQAAKLFEKAAAEYTACDISHSAAECYYSAAYNFMLADVYDKSAQCYILAAKMYEPTEYNKSILSYLYAADIYENQRRLDMCMKCYDTVAGIYLKNGLNKEAIRFYEQCIQTASRGEYNTVFFQEKIAVIQTTCFGYYATAITVYDSIIQKTLNQPIVYPFMMIAIMLRILSNDENNNTQKYIDWCLGVDGFSTTDYYMFITPFLI
jgi:tetratricopeptide (TPR) repeat protein